MKHRFAGLFALAFGVVAVATLAAHHEILAKFDDKKPVTLRGIVTRVDWLNPHVHVFINVKDAAYDGQLGDRARKRRRSSERWMEPRFAQAGRRDHRSGHCGTKRRPPGLGPVGCHDRWRKEGPRCRH